MPTFVVEMLWDCRYCKQTLNRGLEKHCRNCGHPKDDDDREYMPEHVSIQDALEGDKKARAEAGPDWKCKHCGALQNPLNRCCTECGVPQGEGAKTWKATEQAATYDLTSGAKTSEAPPQEVIVEPKHEIPPPSPRVAPAPTPAPAFVRASPKRPKDSGALVFALYATPCLLALSGLLWFLFHPRVVDTHVTAVSWTHSVKIDRYQTFHREGWDPDPTAFNTHDEGSRVHHYDHVRVGSHEEKYTAKEKCGEDCETVKGSCHTTARTCTSNHNGTATCTGGDRVCDPDRQSCEPKYCPVTKTKTVDDYEDQPRYRDWYTWDVWAWDYNRTVVATGATLEERWPSEEELKPPHLNEGEKEREAARLMEHKVTFANAKGSWAITPKECSEFEKYPIGSGWRLKTSLAGSVEVLQGK